MKNIRFFIVFLLSVCTLSCGMSGKENLPTDLEKKEWIEVIPYGGTWVLPWGEVRQVLETKKNTVFFKQNSRDLELPVDELLTQDGAANPLLETQCTLLTLGGEDFPNRKITFQKVKDSEDVYSLQMNWDTSNGRYNSRYVMDRSKIGQLKKEDEIMEQLIPKELASQIFYRVVNVSGGKEFVANIYSDYKERSIYFDVGKISIDGKVWKVLNSDKNSKGWVFDLENDATLVFEKNADSRLENIDRFELKTNQSGTAKSQEDYLINGAKINEFKTKQKEESVDDLSPRSTGLKNITILTPVYDKTLLHCVENYSGESLKDATTIASIEHYAKYKYNNELVSYSKQNLFLAPSEMIDNVHIYKRKGSLKGNFYIFINESLASGDARLLSSLFVVMEERIQSVEVSGQQQLPGDATDLFLTIQFTDDKGNETTYSYNYDPEQDDYRISEISVYYKQRDVRLKSKKTKTPKWLKKTYNLNPFHDVEAQHYQADDLA